MTIQARMAADYPALYYCRLNLVVSLTGLGNHYHLAGRAAEARDVYARHFRELERMLAPWGRLRPLIGLCILAVRMGRW